jgi:hypothetical protein
MSEPGYWMHETSGVLRPAVEAYLNDEPLSRRQIAALRAYFRQWIASPVWDRNPHAGVRERAWLTRMRARVDQLTNRQALSDWIAEAIDNGIDPL